jgi:hypothetical protein
MFTFASATSFHRQIFPDETIAFGSSASAMHWLSAKPGPCFGSCPRGRASESECASYRKQALSDWTMILLARARDLTPRGKLVLINFCVDERGRYLGNTAEANLLARAAPRARASNPRRPPR